MRFKLLCSVFGRTAGSWGMASPIQFRCRRGNKQWKSSCVAVYQFESIAAWNPNVGNSILCPSQEAEPHDLALSERSGARPMSCWSTTEGANGFIVLQFYCASFPQAVFAIQVGDLITLNISPHACARCLELNAHHASLSFHSYWFHWRSFCYVLESNFATLSCSPAVEDEGRARDGFSDWDQWGHGKTSGEVSDANHFRAIDTGNDWLFNHVTSFVPGCSARAGKAFPCPSPTVKAFLVDG